MQIDTLEAIRLGDATQWIRVRGEDPSKPPILHIQQGPGVPVPNEVRRFVEPEACRSLLMRYLA